MQNHQTNSGGQICTCVCTISSSTAICLMIYINPFYFALSHYLTIQFHWICFTLVEENINRLAPYECEGCCVKIAPEGVGRWGYAKPGHAASAAGDTLQTFLIYHFRDKNMQIHQLINAGCICTCVCTISSSTAIFLTIYKNPFYFALKSLFDYTISLDLLHFS